jgi:hypothetical protein
VANLTAFVNPVTRLIAAAYRTVKRPVGLEGRAWVCTWTHPMVIAIDRPTPRGPKHIDVKLRAWNTSTERITILGLASATAAGQDLAAGRYVRFRETTLEGGGPSQELYFALVPATSDAELVAAAGDTLPIRLRMSRGIARFSPRLRLVIAARERETR